MSKLAAFMQIASGMIMATAHQTLPVDPAGWLLCDGRAVSRTDYAHLFTSIGDAFGAGDGSTTFNIPDLRGEFLRGADRGRGVDPGRECGTAQGDEFKSHSHGVYGNNQLVESGNTEQVVELAGTTNDSDVNSHESGGTETRPRNIAVNYLIKT